MPDPILTPKHPPGERSLATRSQPSVTFLKLCTCHLKRCHRVAKCSCDFWRCYYFHVASQHLGPTSHAQLLTAKPLNLVRGSVRAHLAMKVAGFKPLYLGTNASPVANLVKMPLLRRRKLDMCILFPFKGGNHFFVFPFACGIMHV